GGRRTNPAPPAGSRAPPPPPRPRKARRRREGPTRGPSGPHRHSRYPRKNAWNAGFYSDRRGGLRRTGREGQPLSDDAKPEAGESLFLVEERGFGLLAFGLRRLRVGFGLSGCGRGTGESRLRLLFAVVGLGELGDGDDAVSLLQVDQAHALRGAARLADVLDLDPDEHPALRDQEELV